MSGNRKTKLHILITILIMLFIFWQSAMPAAVSELESGSIVSRLAEWLQADEALVSFVVRKSAHFTEFLILGVSLFLTVRDLRKRASFWIPWLIGAVYAVSDELHQHFVPGRSCEVRDMIIDVCGVLVGVAILARLSKTYNGGSV